MRSLVPLAVAGLLALTAAPSSAWAETARRQADRAAFVAAQEKLRADFAARAPRSVIEHDRAMVFAARQQFQADSAALRNNLPSERYDGPWLSGAKIIVVQPSRESRPAAESEITNTLKRIDRFQ